VCSAAAAATVLAAARAETSSSSVEATATATAAAAAAFDACTIRRRLLGGDVPPDELYDLPVTII